MACLNGGLWTTAVGEYARELYGDQNEFALAGGAETLKSRFSF